MSTLENVKHCMPTVVLIVIVIWDEVTCLALQKMSDMFFPFVLVVKHFLLYLC